MFQSQLPRKSNIFDDHKIHPERLHKYKNADVLDLMSFSKSLKSSLGNLQEPSLPTESKILTQEVSTSKTWSLNIPKLDQSILTPIKTQNVNIENSTAITQVPGTEDSQNRKVPLSNASETLEQQVPYRLSTIFEEESSSQEKSPTNVENSKIDEKIDSIKDTGNKLLDGVKEFPAINLKDIKLDASINFQFKDIEFPLAVKPKTSEEEALKSVENQQEEPITEKNEGIDQDELENSHGIIPYDYNEPISDNKEDFIPEPHTAVKVNIDASIMAKVDIEDRGVDTCDLMIVEKVEQEIQVAPVRVDKVVDTAELRFEEEKEENKEDKRKEEVIKEDKVVDTNQLVVMQDEFTETIELEDDERKKSIEEVKLLKYKFLGELHGLRNKLDLIKKDQANSKQSNSESLKETIKSVSEFVRAGLEKYIREKSQKQVKNLRAYQIEVSQTRKELDKLKSFVQFTADEMKKKIAVFLKGEGKNLLEKLIDDSGKEKIRQFGLTKLGEMLGDGNSVTTDSSHVTPSKATPSKTTPSKARQSYRKLRHRLDPAVMEGLLYLFDHDALKNPLGNDKAFKEKLRKIFKANEADKSTSEFLLNTLMDRSSRKREKSESRAPSESGEKRRKKSFHEDDEDDDDDKSDLKSVTSERAGLSTPGKGSRGKQAKRKYMSYKSFTDDNGDKVFVVPEDIEQEQNE